MGHPMADLRQIITQFEYVCDDLAKKHGVEHLAGPQGQVIIFLDQHRQQEIFIKDIEQALHISKSVASNLVKRMEKNGFIQVLPSEFDRRRKQVLLATRGESKIKLLQAFHNQMKGEVFQGIDHEDLHAMKRVLAQLKINLKQFKGG